MRILALHGLGSSAAMLKEQLTPLMRVMGSSCQFVFLDGAIPCGRGPAVPGWANDPFQSYASGFTPSEMRAAQARLQTCVEQKGPFDGVLGFSLGAAMAISYIMEQHRTKRDERPPFAFAVLFSPIFVASANDKCYEDLINRLLDADHADFRATFPHEDFLDMLKSEDERIFAEYLRVVLSMHTSVGDILPNNHTRFEFFDHDDGKETVKLENVPRLMHPLLLKERLRIPSVVVTGQKDVGAMAEQSRVATMMCSPSVTRLYRHDGGHDVPFKKSDVQAIVRLINDAAEDGAEMLSPYDF